MKRGRQSNGLPHGFRVREGEFASSAVPRLVHKTIAFLEKLSFGELMTTRQMAAQMGRSLTHFQHHMKHEMLGTYKHYMSNSQGGTLWGNKKTIQELKKKLRSE